MGTMILLSGHKAEREAAATAIRRSKWGQHGENLDGAYTPVALVRCQPFDEFPIGRPGRRGQIVRLGYRGHAVEQGCENVFLQHADLNLFCRMALHRRGV